MAATERAEQFLAQLTECGLESTFEEFVKSHIRIYNRMSYYYPGGSGDKPPGIYSGMVAGPVPGTYQQNGLPAQGVSVSNPYAPTSHTYGSALAAAANSYPAATMYGSTLTRSPYAASTQLMPATTLAYPQPTLPPSNPSLSHNPYIPGSTQTQMYSGMGLSASRPGFPSTSPTDPSSSGMFPSAQYGSAQYGLGLASPALSPINPYPAAGNPVAGSYGSYPVGNPTMGPSGSYLGPSGYTLPRP